MIFDSNGLDSGIEIGAYILFLISCLFVGFTDNYDLAIWTMLVVIYLINTNKKTT